MKNTTPKQTIIRVCNDPTCAKKGTESIIRKIKETFGLIEGQKNDNYDLAYCGCVGCCDFAPNLLINDSIVIQNANPHTVIEEITKAANTVVPTKKEKMANLDKVLDDLI